METTNNQNKQKDVSRIFAWYEGQEKGQPKMGVISGTNKRILQGRFMDNTASIITEEDYGKRFENKLRGNLNNLFNNRADANLIKEEISPSMRKQFDLINAGYTSSRSLGREHDKELNRITLRQLNDYGYQNAGVLEDERRWVEYASNDKDMTVQELVSTLTAERIATDNTLLDTLKTKEELAEAGYTLSPIAVPVLERGDEKLYDITFAQKKAGANPPIPTYTILPSGKELTIDAFNNMKQIENMNQVLYSLAKSAGIKIVQDNSLPAGQTSFKRSRLRSFGRRILSGFRIRTNGKSRAIPTAGVLRYSTQGNQAADVYNVIKAVSGLSCGYALDRTSKLIAKQSPSNLPNISDFVMNSSKLQDISASLIAADLVLMSDLSANDAKVLRSLYKLDAAQKLSSLEQPQGDKNNNWVVPLVSSYYLNGVQHFANDFNVNLSTLSEKLGTTPERASINGSIMGLCDWAKMEGKGLLTGAGIPQRERKYKQKDYLPEDTYEEMQERLRKMALELQEDEEEFDIHEEEGESDIHEEEEKKGGTGGCGGNGKPRTIEDEMFNIYSTIALNAKSGIPDTKATFIKLFKNVTLSNHKAIDKKIISLQNQISKLKKEDAKQERLNKIEELSKRQDLLADLNTKIDILNKNGIDKIKADLETINIKISNGEPVTKELLVDKRQLETIIKLNDFAERASKSTRKIALKERDEDPYFYKPTATSLYKKFVNKAIPNTQKDKTKAFKSRVDGFVNKNVDESEKIM